MQDAKRLHSPAGNAGQHAGHPIQNSLSLPSSISRTSILLSADRTDDSLKSPQDINNSTYVTVLHAKPIQIQTVSELLYPRRVSACVSCQEYTYRQRTFAVVAGLIALFLRSAAIVLQGIAHYALRYCSSGACFGYHCGFHTERSCTEMLCLLHHARLFWVSSSVETQC